MGEMIWLKTLALLVFLGVIGYLVRIADRFFEFGDEG